MSLVVYRAHKNLRKVTTERFPDQQKPQHRIIRDEHITDETLFTNVDFVPSFCKKVKNKVIYHSFTSLVSLANNWLLNHPGWQVVSCETVEQYNHNIFEKIDYSAVVNILRLWIRRSDETHYEHDPIFWYKDFTPENDGDNFEAMESIIDRVNGAISDGRINGKILQIETVKCQANDMWHYKSDATYINDGKTRKNINRYHNIIMVIRIFFEIGQMLDDEIIIADFVPTRIEPEEGNGNAEQWQTFSDLIDKASTWLQENPELSFCNAQAIDIRVPELDQAINTRATYRIRKDTDKEMRFLRLYCTKHTEMGKLFLSSMQNISLFSLKQKFKLKSKTFDWKNFHHNVNIWYQQLKDNTSIRLITMETVIVPAYIEEAVSFERAANSTIACSQMEGRLKYSFIAVRIYYQDATVEMTRTDEKKNETFTP